MALESARSSSSAQTRAVLGTLLVAWTFVTGCALAIGSAWYYRTKDINVLLAYLGAPFLVGTALFLTIGFVTLVSRGVDREPLEPAEFRPKRSEALGSGRRSR